MPHAVAHRSFIRAANVAHEFCQSHQHVESETSLTEAVFVATLSEIARNANGNPRGATWDSLIVTRLSSSEDSKHLARSACPAYECFASWYVALCPAHGCFALQCVAVNWNVLQCVAVYPARDSNHLARSARSVHECLALRCVAVCCHVLQCVAVCPDHKCFALQCVATCCSALKYDAVFPDRECLALTVRSESRMTACFVQRSMDSEIQLPFSPTLARASLQGRPGAVLLLRVRALPPPPALCRRKDLDAGDELPQDPFCNWQDPPCTDRARTATTPQTVSSKPLVLHVYPPARVSTCEYTVTTSWSCKSHTINIVDLNSLLNKCWKKINSRSCVKYQQPSEIDR